MISLDTPLTTQADISYDVLHTRPTLPNIKELFIPDRGMILFDSDLEQADAQTVAWESHDDILKEIFHDPDLDLHTENAKMIFGSCPSKSHPNRKKAKAGCHAVNFGVHAPTLAKTLGITRMEAESFIRRWFDIHPGILEWHERTQANMVGRGWIENAFGNRQYFLGDTSHPLALSEALAWVPQSTTGLIINRAWRTLDSHPDIEVLMQVHDSLVFQVPEEKAFSLLPFIHDAMHVPVPYDDPMTIGSSIDTSDESWGNIKGISWDGYFLDSEGVATNEPCPWLRAA